MIQTIAALIALLLAPAPNRALYKDSGARDEMALHFVDAGDFWLAGYHVLIDSDLLVVWSFGESSLRADAEGALGEIGLFQVHGVRRRTCEKVGFDLSSPRQQIKCGAMLIDMDRRYCGSLERGLMRYASGRCRGTPRARRIVKRRLRQLKHLKKKLLGGKGELR